MDYSKYLAGSPLIPRNLIAAYALGLIFFFCFTYLFLCQKKSCRQLKNRLSLFFKIVIISQLVFFFILGIFASYLLLPTPAVVNTTTNGQITINFSKPVSREIMEKSIEPEVPGVWLFEDSLYATHLYSKLVFYPDSGFEPGTQYTVKLKQISNTSKFSSPYEYEYKFTTPQVQNATVTTTPTKVRLTVPAYLQKRALSCEVATLRMALAYRNVTVSEDDLLNQVGLDPTPHQGGTWGNPHKAFVGDVNGKQMTSGYGVYWEPIARVAKNYRQATDFRNWSVSQLTSELSKGNPVIIWGYSRNGTPTYWNTPTGERIYAVAGEHTVVAVGFVGPASNPTQIIVNDPLVGQVYWSRATFDKKWASFSQSGVVIY